MMPYIFSWINNLYGYDVGQKGKKLHNGNYPVAIMISDAYISFFFIISTSLNLLLLLFGGSDLSWVY